MKKIGILTFHNAINYGAVLQAYALQEFLSSTYDTDIVDYHCKYMESNEKQDLSLKKMIHNVVFFRQEMALRKKRKKFLEFKKKYFKLSVPYSKDNINKAIDCYDKFIAGSDQVWNTRITGDDFTYFLPFASKPQKYSYAASFGGTSIDEKFIDSIKIYLSDFSSILVRETSGKKLLEDLKINKKIDVVLDPVFLFNSNEWIQKLELNRKEQGEDYILFFKIEETNYAMSFAKQLSEKTNLKVKYINLYSGLNKAPKEFENILDCGPIDFLNLVLNAKYIVTTSFHALAFSLIFHKQCFYELKRTNINNNARLNDLAKQVGIEGNEIISEDKTKYSFNYNWEKIDEVLGTLINFSKKSLLK